MPLSNAILIALLPAYLLPMIYQGNDFLCGTASGFIYVENEGNVEIDDELIITIKNLIGDTVYRKKKQIYLEPGESEFVRFSWTIPEGSSSGTYRFKAEFEDVDALPTTKSFVVGGFNLLLPSRRSKKLKKLLLISIALGAITSGCIGKDLVEEGKIIQINPSKLVLGQSDVSDEWFLDSEGKEIDEYSNVSGYFTLFKSKELGGAITEYRYDLASSIYVYPNIKSAINRFRVGSLTESQIKKDFGDESYYSKGKSTDYFIYFRENNVIATVHITDYREENGPRLKEVEKYAKILEQKIKKAAEEQQ